MSPRRFAVIGNPIAHSLSPQMHEGWIADHKLDATYEAHLFAGDDRAFVEWVRAQRLYNGANVTVPFKAAAMESATVDRRLDDVANVLTWHSDGRIAAANTDGDGFLASLDEGAPDWRTHVRKVLIVGAGGAATGIARALARTIKGEGREIVIVNRSGGRAAALAALVSACPCRADAWSALPDAFAATDLIVQTTTLGMSGAASPDWPIAQCRPTAIIADIIYRPLDTPLLKAARARGLIAVDGLGMLIHQGALAFKIWFGVQPDTNKARERLMKLLGEGA